MLQLALPPNRFKQRLIAHERLLGIWSALADPYAAEILAGCCYDWVLIDAEHGPNDLRSVLGQLRSLAAASALFGIRAQDLSQPVVRIPEAAPALIKQYLEIGVRNLLVPMVNTPAQASEIVRATRYAPQGIRGMGSSLARSSQWGRYSDYVREANDGVCVIVQAETKEAIENLEGIVAVEGVDAVLFGAADLAADLGYPGQREHPEVTEAIRSGVATVRGAGKPAGIMLTNVPATRAWLEEGVTFAGVGVDTALLVQAATDLLRQFRPGDDES